MPDKPVKFTCTRYYLAHDDVIKWEHFQRYWPFVRGIHRSPVNSQRPVTRSFDIYIDLRLNERLSKQSWSWWFETQLCPLWRHSNAQWISKLRVGCSLLVLRLQCDYVTKRPLQWLYNGSDGVSNHQPHDCLLNALFRRRPKKTSKFVREFTGDRWIPRTKGQ